MNIPQYLETIKGKLRPCQAAAVLQFTKFCKLKDNEGKAFLVNLPTGAGKTGVISLIAHLSSDEKVLIICHRKAVKDQLYREVSRKFFRSTIDDQTVKLKKTYRDSNFNGGPGIYISSFQKLSRLEEKDLTKIQEEFDLIIVDEGHSEPSPVWKEIIRQSQALKVVVTATPYRNDLFELNVSTKHAFVFTFKNAIQDDIIYPPTFEQILGDDAIARRVEDFLLQNPDLKCIVKCRSIEDIEKYHDIFAARFKTTSIHERFDNKEAENKFKRVGVALNNTESRIFIHQHKLDEGVDIPEAKLLVLTYELSSGRELVQAVGRVVRKHGAIHPTVLDLTGGVNKSMWDGYERFDNYISSESGARDFVKSLSTSYLIESFLSSFPQQSYFSGRFRERVDLNSITPEKDLTIPLASVCFIQKQADFSANLLIDRIYWELHSSGSLVKRYDDTCEMSIIIYVSFNKSKFFADKLFFEPRLDVIIVKEIPSGVAIFDSGGGRYYNQEKYRLKGPIHIDRLTALAAITKLHRVKETHAKAIGRPLQRPEHVALKGSDLDNSRSNQSNSKYALTMLKVDNIGADGKKSSSYYIGARSGRISDQKESNFTLQDLSEWIDTIDSHMRNGAKTSRLIKSYAQPIEDKPNSEILAVLLDFTSLEIPRTVGNGTIDPDFNYIDVINDTFVINPTSTPVEISLSFKHDKSRFELSLHGISQGLTELEWIPTHLQVGSHLKVLFKDGTTYFDGKFYKLSLPFEQGINAKDSWASTTLYELDSLSKQDLKEKGTMVNRQYLGTTLTDFDPNSVFYMLDKLREYGNPNAVLSDLGPFANHIPGCDFVLCCDMGTEPADFIISSPEKLCFVHVKCGDTESPESSAGALAEVGSQAVKNIHMLVSNDDQFKPGNIKSWDSSWPSANSKFPLETRYRLFGGTIRKKVPTGSSLSKQAWDLVCERRKSIRCKKEIWIVSANAFSRNHFVTGLSNPQAAFPETIQAYQLIEDWLSTADELDVDLKIFTSK
ncbi:DEAD/DEAH box helicase [Pseudomonas putida]|uniref:DEAD/DEAH box helicase n=1 Tax=Pseudomonas putida TaxID=303 RepID=UPI000D331E8B|nr:DEAD/DEAH box helicase family protein [Pseudomonas putida]PTV59679.1 type III restriction endonuclease subunit R [Pseudomonas putida]